MLVHAGVVTARCHPDSPAFRRALKTDMAPGA